MAADRPRCFKPIETCPSLHHPRRMPLGQRQVRRGVLCSSCCRRVRELAEYGVDHSRCKAVPGLLGQLHTLIDCGAGGNTIKMQQLKGAETQSNQYFDIEFCIWMLEMNSQLMIEAYLPAKHAKHKG